MLRSCTEAILRDQAKGLIGPMDAREMSVALNRFNVTYLNDRFGNPRRKSKDTDAATALATLERVWMGTLYGKVSLPKGKPHGGGGTSGRRESQPDRGRLDSASRVADPVHNPIREGANLIVDRSATSPKRKSKPKVEA